MSNRQTDDLDAFIDHDPATLELLKLEVHEGGITHVDDRNCDYFAVLKVVVASSGKIEVKWEIHSNVDEVDEPVATTTHFSLVAKYIENLMMRKKET